jgi:hypothetical protein
MKTGKPSEVAKAMKKKDLNLNFGNVRVLSKNFAEVLSIFFGVLVVLASLYARARLLFRFCSLSRRSFPPA